MPNCVKLKITVLSSLPNHVKPNIIAQIQKVVNIFKVTLKQNSIKRDLPVLTRADHLIPGLIFFSGKLYYVEKWQKCGTRGKSVQVYVQNQKPLSPRIRSVEACK